MIPIITQIPQKGNVVILGYPASGKTQLLKEIKKGLKGKASYYNTDDYIKHGFEEALYALMKDLKKDKAPLKIIEGVIGYRLLRKGAELKTFYPDLVINCFAPIPARIDRIRQRDKDPRATMQMDKGLTKVWDDFMKLNKVKFKLVRYDS